MSISYSCLRTHGKVTLPSVDMWGTDMNILRDPKKSIHTRRKDKVGSTSAITVLNSESYDRIDENIQVYARGVNPMVEVSYNNHGNNYTGTMSKRSGEAKLPYRIMNGGAFRPPILSQRQLMPLSRQPRPWTDAYTQPSFPIFQRQNVCHKPKYYKQVRNDITHMSVRPTSIYKLQKPLKRNFTVKEVIKNPIQVQATSGIRTRDLTRNINIKPSHSLLQKPLVVEYNTNLSKPKKVENFTVDTKRYLQNPVKATVNTNISKNIQITPIHQLSDYNINNNIKQNIPTINYQTPKSSSKSQDYIHKDIQLNKVLPVHTQYTNKGQNIYRAKTYDNSIELSRNRPLASVKNTRLNINRDNSQYKVGYKRLRPKPSYGSIEGQLSIPSVHRIETENNNIYENKKHALSRKIYDLRQNRSTQIRY